VDLLGSGHDIGGISRHHDDGSVMGNGSN